MSEVKAGFARDWVEFFAPMKMMKRAQLKPLLT